MLFKILLTMVTCGNRDYKKNSFGVFLGRIPNFRTVKKKVSMTHSALK